MQKTLSLFEGKKFYYQTIDKWIKNDYKNLHIDDKNTDKTSENIDIVEMNELYTYIKKNPTKSEYGLLFLGTKCVLIKL